MSRSKLAILVLLLALVVVVLSLLPKYEVGENLCVRNPFTTVGNEQVATGRYRVASRAVPPVWKKMFTFSSGGGYYGIVPIDASGLETGGQVRAPAGPLESNSDDLSKASHECP